MLCFHGKPHTTTVKKSELCTTAQSDCRSPIDGIKLKTPEKQKKFANDCHHVATTWGIFIVLCETLKHTCVASVGVAPCNY